MSFTLPDGLTLKNKLGATNHDHLEQREHPKLAQRLIELYEGHGPEQTFDTAHLQALHKHLFQDVYEWAGRFRHETFIFADGTRASMSAMRKVSGKDFAIGNEIDRGLKSLMSDLESRNYLRGLDRETFASEAAAAFAHLNAIHPFREGNGRVQREFFSALAERAGHFLEFGVISAERMVQSSIAAHERGDLGPLRRMFIEITDPERVRALEAAQDAIERFRPVQAPHVTAWDGIYMATTEPHQEYEGRFAGAAGQHFMVQPDDGSIIIGRIVDLPDPPPNSGTRIRFTASHVQSWGADISPGPLVPARDVAREIGPSEIRTRMDTAPHIVEARAALAAACRQAGRNEGDVLHVIDHAAINGRVGDRNIVETLGAGRSPGSAGHRLVSAADTYLRHVHALRQTMTHERTDLADRAGTVIPRPSQELIDAISRGNQMPDTLRAELRSIAGAFDRRFGEDLAALRAGKGIDQLAQRHGLDPNVLASARDVLTQLDKGIKQARTQDRAQTVNRGGPVR